ncbi:MAG: hypothetical protein H7844_06035 [Nitrospirae bacterium YQR-1]
MDDTHNNLRFVYICTLAFFILTLFNIVHHEMWRDELEAWMIARDAASLDGLVENMRYQGHPMLWHLILYPLTKITRNPAAMQAVHLLIATVSAFIFLRFAPFSKLLRTLFIFGYFPFFEFATISRNYAIGTLFLFIFCACFGKDLKNRNYIMLSAVLFLMCQCNALSTILAIALAATIFIEPVLMKDYSVYRTGRFYISLLIFTAGLVLSLIQMTPPSDSYWYNPVLINTDIAGRIEDQISEMWNVFIPVPRIEMTFLGTNILSYLPVQRETRYILRMFASFVLFLFPLFIVLRKKTAVFYYITAIVGVTAFGYIFYEGSLRHKAHYYFAFVSTLWIAGYYTSAEFTKKTSFNVFLDFFERNKNRFTVVIFSAGVISALIANTLDYIYQFSESKEAANYIKQNNWQNMPISGFWDFASSGVSAYLDRPFFYPVPGKMGTFTVWRAEKRTEAVDVLKVTQSYMKSVRSDVLLVFNSPVKNYELRHYRLVPLKQFTKSIVKSEKFFLYMMLYENTGREN